MQPGPRRRWVTFALIMGMFLAALEGTAVAAAMPTVVGELGGVALYSWVFSAYLLTSTTTVPLYGKLSDLFGRKRIFFIAVGLFLLGSALSGLARSMEQLILFRAIQGLGAGGVMPVTVTLIGDLFTLEERGKMQGLFSAVWGVSSLAGPALGGVVTDLLSWRWVFYLNLPFGLISVLILRAALVEPVGERQERKLDLLGTLTLTAAVTLLLVALLGTGSEGGGAEVAWTSPRTLGLLAASGVALMLFLFQERRAAEPMLPLHLFKNPLISVADAGSAVIGGVIYAASAFVPMYGQGVLQGTAIDAGMLLAPISVGWPLASTIGGRLVLSVGYRSLLITGGSLIAGGTALLALTPPGADRLWVMAAMFVTGLGMGLTSTSHVVAVQNAVPWGLRGVATSSIQFFRSMGGAVTVAVLGVLLTARVARSPALESLGVGGSGSPGSGTGGAGLGRTDALLDPAARATLDPAVADRLADALAFGLDGVFTAVAFLGLLTLALAFAFPRGSARSHQHEESRASEG